MDGRTDGKNERKKEKKNERKNIRRPVKNKTYPPPMGIRNKKIRGACEAFTASMNTGKVSSLPDKVQDVSSSPHNVVDKPWMVKC